MVRLCNGTTIFVLKAVTNLQRFSIFDPFDFYKQALTNNIHPNELLLSLLRPLRLLCTVGSKVTCLVALFRVKTRGNLPASEKPTV